MFLKDLYIGMSHQSNASAVADTAIADSPSLAEVDKEVKRALVKENVEKEQTKLLLKKKNDYSD